MRRNSKLKPEEFIDTLIFSEFDHSLLSLQDHCNDLAHHHRCSLSKVGLHKRFNEQSLDFLKLILAEQISSKLNIVQENSWQPFSRVIIADSSKFALPEKYKDVYPGYGGARSKALMNIQYAFDIKHGDWEILELTKGTENDMAYSKRALRPIVRGELHIRDLGYMTQGGLSEIVHEQAFFLNRLHPLWKPVETATGKPVDWKSLNQKIQHGKSGCFETMVTIGSGEDVFNCRLVAIPVPEKVWAERIRKTQIKAKSQGYQLSEEYKQRSRFSFFITNTESSILKTQDIIELYRLRWQIELVFKTWKSLVNVHKVKAVKIERLECQLIAKFIWILLNWKIFRTIDAFIRKQSPGYACSVWKFFKYIRQNCHTIRAVALGIMTFEDWCKMFLFRVINNLLIEPKKNKKPGFMIVNDIFNPLS